RIGGIRYHWIQADDSPHEDLLTHFPEAYDIIDKCVVSGTGILMHCMAGVSQSTTIVCSYLMKKRRKTYEEIHSLVQCRRPIISPNHGFVAQLGLWEGMGFRLDANNKQFRHYMREMYSLHTFPVKKMDQYFPRLDGREYYPSVEFRQTVCLTILNV
ncbi:unnamed protein product, partial [Oppiella nova]